MGAAQHDGADVGPQRGREDGSQMVLHFRTVEKPLLHEPDKLRAGKGKNIAAGAVLGHQMGKLFLPQRDLRGHDDDPAAGAALRCQLQSGFDADDDDIGILKAQLIDGCAGGGVASS